MKIIDIDIKSLKEYENNPRHNDAAVEKVAASIREFGFKVPIVIDKDNVIVCGHTRKKAAELLGLDNVPCIIADDLTDEQIKAFRLADNKTGEFAEWDFAKLETELAALADIDFDMEQFGFEFDSDDGITVIEDEAPEIDEDTPPVTQLGDIWQLGRHRLMCGDSTDPVNIDLLMNGNKADLVFTDPPYNMSDNPSMFVSNEMKERLDKIVDFQPETIKESIFEIDTNSYFLFTSKELIPRYFKIFENYGFNILVWCKDNPTPMTNNTFLPDVEYLLYFYKNGRIWNNGLDVSLYKKYYNSNKLEGRKEAGNVHPTIKPIKIIADKIQICSKNKGIVVDIFGGSGSTLIACEQLNRTCYMMELDPKYCDVIIKRWETLTGEKAVRL